MMSTTMTKVAIIGWEAWAELAGAMTDTGVEDWVGVLGDSVGGSTGE